VHPTRRSATGRAVDRAGRCGAPAAMRANEVRRTSWTKVPNAHQAARPAAPAATRSGQRRSVPRRAGAPLAAPTRTAQAASRSGLPTAGRRPRRPALRAGSRPEDPCPSPTAAYACLNYRRRWMLVGCSARRSTRTGPSRVSGMPTTGTGTTVPNPLPTPHQRAVPRRPTSSRPPTSTTGAGTTALQRQDPRPHLWRTQRRPQARRGLSSAEKTRPSKAPPRPAPRHGDREPGGLTSPPTLRLTDWPDRGLSPVPARPAQVPRSVSSVGTRKAISAATGQPARASRARRTSATSSRSCPIRMAAS